MCQLLLHSEFSSTVLRGPRSCHPFTKQMRKVRHGRVRSLLQVAHESEAELTKIIEVSCCSCSHALITTAPYCLRNERTAALLEGGDGEEGGGGWSSQLSLQVAKGPPRNPQSCPT